MQQHGRNISFLSDLFRFCILLFLRRLPLNGNRTGFRPTEAGQKSKAEKEKTTAKQSFYSFRPLFLRLSFTLQWLYGGEVSDLGRV